MELTNMFFFTKKGLRVNEKEKTCCELFRPNGASTKTTNSNHWGKIEKNRSTENFATYLLEIWPNKGYPSSRKDDQRKERKTQKIVLCHPRRFLFLFLPARKYERPEKFGLPASLPAFTWNKTKDFFFCSIPLNFSVDECFYWGQTDILKAESVRAIEVCGRGKKFWQPAQTKEFRGENLLWPRRG